MYKGMNFTFVPPPPKFGSEKYTPFLRSTPPPRRWQVTVNIERTSMNSRRISGSIVINRPIEVSTPVCVVEEECYYCCCCCCVVAIKGSTILALRCEGRQAVRGCAMWKRWYFLCVCSARVFFVRFVRQLHRSMPCLAISQCG